MRRARLPPVEDAEAGQTPSAASGGPSPAAGVGGETPPDAASGAEAPTQAQPAPQAKPGARRAPSQGDTPAASEASGPGSGEADTPAEGGAETAAQAEGGTQEPTPGPEQVHEPVWDTLPATPLDTAFGTGYPTAPVAEVLKAHNAVGLTEFTEGGTPLWTSRSRGTLAALCGRGMVPGSAVLAWLITGLLGFVALGTATGLTVVCLLEGMCGSSAIPSASPFADNLYVIFSMWVLCIVAPAAAVSLALQRQGPLLTSLLLTASAAAACIVSGIIALADSEPRNVESVAGGIWPQLTPVERSFFGDRQATFEAQLRRGSVVYGTLGFVIGVLLGLVALAQLYLVWAWGGWLEDRCTWCCPAAGARLVDGDTDASAGFGVSSQPDASQPQHLPRPTSSGPSDRGDTGGGTGESKAADEGSIPALPQRKSAAPAASREPTPEAGDAEQPHAAGVGGDDAGAATGSDAALLSPQRGLAGSREGSRSDLLRSPEGSATSQPRPRRALAAQ